MDPRTPLVRPWAYFADREVSLLRGVGALAALLVLSVLMVAAVSMTFTANLDGAVSTGEYMDSRCDDGDLDVAPSAYRCSDGEVVQSVESVSNEAFAGLYLPVLVGMPIVVAVVAALLHMGTALSGGEGTYLNTVTVAAWGMLASSLVGPLAVGLLWLLMDPVTVTPATEPSELRARVFASIQTWRTVATGLKLVGMGWAAVVWTAGLERGRAVSRRGAAVPAAVVAGLVFLLSL